MSELNTFIDKELQYIRSLAGELAAKRAKLSSRLSLRESGESSDPHVERLIESFAMLTGRIRHKLDDELPEISDALLSALYPHYLAPTPSMSIVQFKLSAAQADQVKGYAIAAKAELESESTADGACTYRTCWPVRIWPIDVTAALLQQRQTQIPGSSFSNGLIRITLSTLSAGKLFSAQQLGKLRFYIAGQDHYAFALYELILNQTLNISIGEGADGANPRFLGTSILMPAGFDPADAIIEPDSRTFPGYRLLSEYFSFPRKFLFFDVDLSKVSLEKLGSTIILQFHLTKSSTEIEPHINAGTFRLGCTPIVNLLTRPAEPIPISQTRVEFPVELYSSNNQSYEVYKIESVVALSPEGRKVAFAPFYSARHGSRDSDQRYWHASRRPSQPVQGRQAVGTDVFLSLVDLSLVTFNPPNWTVQAEVLCTNRDLPKLLPGGEGRPRFSLVLGGVPSIHTLVSPTAPLRPKLGRGVVWGLVSHLLLNHLSLSESSGSPDALKEILQLYNMDRTPESQAKIDSIQSFSSERTIARARGAAAGGFCHGVRVNLEFDENGFINKDGFLFASVLERFVSLYASINSFTQLVARSRQRPEILKKWPPRAGTTGLI